MSCQIWDRSDLNDTKTYHLGRVLFGVEMRHIRLTKLRSISYLQNRTCLISAYGRRTVAFHGGASNDRMAEDFVHHEVAMLPRNFLRHLGAVMKHPADR
jgi:hypothetical protein